MLPIKISHVTDRLLVNTKQFWLKMDTDHRPFSAATTCSQTALDLLKRPKQGTGCRNHWLTRLDCSVFNFCDAMDGTQSLSMLPLAQNYTQKTQCKTDSMRTSALLPWPGWHPENRNTQGREPRTHNPTLHWRGIPNYLLKVASYACCPNNSTDLPHQDLSGPEAEAKKNSAFGTQGCHSSHTSLLSKDVQHHPSLVAMGAIKETGKCSKIGPWPWPRAHKTLATDLCNLPDPERTVSSARELSGF